MSAINHTTIMKYAITLAKRSRNRTLPNPQVGAIVVKDDKIVGEGYHKKAGGPHAEVYAINSAGKRSKGGTLYVTLEPCSHYGRTPPCTDLIIKTGIKKVFVSMIDPNPLVSGKGVEILKSSGIDVEVGLLEEEARDLNEVYIKNVTRKMPYIIFKSAMTLDGRTATKNGDSKWVTSDVSRSIVHRLRSNVEGVMVGIGTVLKDNPSLTTHGIEDDCPWRIIVDSRLRIPSHARVLNDRFRDKTLVVTTYNAQRQKIKHLETKGIRIIQVASKEGRVDLKRMLRKLYELNIYRLLVEGGATLAGGLLKEKLIDRIIFFIAPRIIGDGRGVFEGFGFSHIKYTRQIKDVIIKRIGADIMIEGKL